VGFLIEQSVIQTGLAEVAGGVRPGRDFKGSSDVCVMIASLFLFHPRFMGRIEPPAESDALSAEVL